MLPPNYSQPLNICTFCHKTWDGNPYEYETDNHEFPCPECAKLLILADCFPKPIEN